MSPTLDVTSALIQAQPARPSPGWLGPKLAAFAEMSNRTRMLLVLLTIWVGLPGLLIGTLEWRRLTFNRLALEHKASIVGNYKAIDFKNNHEVIRLFDTETDGSPLKPRQIRLNRWHRYLYAKYADAAGSPWLPVASDAPKPE